MENCPNCGRVLEGQRGPACPNCGAFLPRSEPRPAAARSGEMPWALEDAPPLPRTRRAGRTLFPPAAAGEGSLLTGGRGGDWLVGFLVVLLVNFGLPSGVAVAIGDAFPVLGSGVTVYLVTVGGYFLLRGRYPSLARGWRAALLLILALGALAVVALLLLVLGLVLICSGLNRP